MGLQDLFRRFRLKYVRLNVSVALRASISFQDAYKDAAWELYIEVLSRIITTASARGGRR